MTETGPGVERRGTCYLIIPCSPSSLPEEHPYLACSRSDTFEKLFQLSVACWSTRPPLFYSLEEVDVDSEGKSGRWSRLCVFSAIETEIMSVLVLEARSSRSGFQLVDFDERSLPGLQTTVFLICLYKALVEGFLIPALQEVLHICCFVDV